MMRSHREARTSVRVFALFLAVVSVLFGGSSASGADVRLDTAKIERLTGAKGTFNEQEGVFKVSVARTDLKVTAAGVKITPPLGLTSWASFMKAGDETMVMGDLVLLEDQVNPVMDVALDNGLEVTALHNHFFWDSPKVMFMHISGIGDEDKLASAVGKVFAKIKDTSGAKGLAPMAMIDPARSSLDTKKIQEILGTTGQMTDGVYKVTLGRTTKVHGHEIGNTMGVNTWGAFAGSDARAVVDGDFAVYEQELQSVLKALRAARINIVAIHHHMSGESPRVVFLHYWGIGSTTSLARGLQAALDMQGSAALPQPSASLSISESDRTRVWSFDRTPTGTLPPGFVLGTFPDGRPAGEWQVVAAPKAGSAPHVLAQAREKGAHFNVVLIDGTSASDLELGVSFLPISGKIDMGGGLIWRATDDRNYYITRANPLEQNIRVYRVVKGVRTMLKNFNQTIDLKNWHTLRVVTQGCRMQIYYDEQPVFDLCDDTFATGRVGLWTKADAVTYFDDLWLKILK